MTLDDAVTKLLTTVMSDMYTEVQDPDNWTLETRDNMVEKLRILRDSSIDVCKNFLDSYKENIVLGRSALDWYLDYHATQSVLAVLMLTRENLDKLSDDELEANSQIDYNWLQAEIRKERHKLSEIEAVLETIDPFKAKTEEL